jgi:hypothetical protein
MLKVTSAVYHINVYSIFNLVIPVKQDAKQVMNPNLNVNLLLLLGVQLVCNPLAPSDPYMGRTAQLTSRRCILNTYSTNIRTEYFKCAA